MCEDVHVNVLTEVSQKLGHSRKLLIQLLLLLPMLLSVLLVLYLLEGFGLVRLGAFRWRSLLLARCKFGCLLRRRQLV